MLILDEFQHLFYAPNLGHFRSATDWLKVLIDETKVAIVACGLPEAQAVVNANEQLARRFAAHFPFRSEEHTSELQSLMRISYAVFCLKKKKQYKKQIQQI